MIVLDQAKACSVLACISAFARRKSQTLVKFVRKSSVIPSKVEGSFSQKQHMGYVTIAG